MKLPSIDHFMNVQSLPSPISSRASSLSSNRSSLSLAATISSSLEHIISPIQTPSPQFSCFDPYSYNYKAQHVYLPNTLVPQQQFILGPANQQSQQQQYQYQYQYHNQPQHHQYQQQYQNQIYYYPMTPSPPLPSQQLSPVTTEFKFQYPTHQTPKKPTVSNNSPNSTTKNKTKISCPRPTKKVSQLDDLDHNDTKRMDGSKIGKPAKRRTRTGCLTCRKRRIKCDEMKPFCGNCAKSKIYCHGYVNKPTKAELKLMAKMKKQEGHTFQFEIQTDSTSNPSSIDSNSRPTAGAHVHNSTTACC
ncbi:hypothetical protein WICPIJ_008721 [Wickerhamomyces pijperi]|uniref:Zn(2)-C6 fungal-type domain-containing protein n=1 Tax=Wickerhamomyces pijperi TaxID=599730 RepID=A0A9P8TGW3_WICPI|nr:hypothetical protein WICPIJ_008721 [Wickerhamomyces pijperi]